MKKNFECSFYFMLLSRGKRRIPRIPNPLWILGIPGVPWESWEYYGNPGSPWESRDYKGNPGSTMKIPKILGVQNPSFPP